MANYALTITPQFTPFTYDELVKPVEKYQQVYDAYNEKVEAMQDEAAKLEQLANNAQDAEAYNQYKSYADKLNNYVDVLRNQGLNNNSRAIFSDLRRQFRTDITPLNEALAKREELGKMQREIAMKNPSYRYKTAASNIGLNEFVKNPNLIIEGVSGDELTKEAQQTFSAFANELTSSHSAAGALILQKYGFTKEDVYEALRNPSATSKNANIINTLVNEMMESKGLNEYSDEDRQFLRGKLIEGAFAGVGKDQLVADYDAQHRIANKYAIKLAKEKAKWQREQGYIPLQDGRWVDKNYNLVDPETGTLKTDEKGNVINIKPMTPKEHADAARADAKQTQATKDPIQKKIQEKRTTALASINNVSSMRSNSEYRPVALAYTIKGSKDIADGFYAGKSGETVRKHDYITEGDTTKLVAGEPPAWAAGQNNGWDNESWSYFTDSDGAEVVNFDISEFDSGMNNNKFKKAELEHIPETVIDGVLKSAVGVSLDDQSQAQLDNYLSNSSPEELLNVINYCNQLMEENPNSDFQIFRLESPRAQKGHTKTYEYVIMKSR